MKKLAVLSGIICLVFSWAGMAQELNYSTGNWDSDSLGNHRILVEVQESADAVYCHIPWRRKDLNPEEKEIVVISEKSGERVLNVIRLIINREYGELVFEPVDGPGKYFLYYLPNTMSGSAYYPTVKYWLPQDLCDPSWKAIFASKIDLQKAKVVEMQSINEFHSFYPMEVIATMEETVSMITEQGKEYLLFPENSLHPIKMWSDLPKRWIDRPYSQKFDAEVKRNESFAFQIGFFSVAKDVYDRDILFSDLIDPAGNIIPSSAFSCYNKGGIDWTGEPLEKEIQVNKRNVQALWMGLQIPRNAKPGIYSGSLTIHPQGLDSEEVNLNFLVSEEVLEDQGDGEPEKHSRLRWLDSRIAEDTEIVQPYIPIRIKGNELHFLGRTLILAANGFPEQIISSFNEEMTGVGAEKTALLYKGMDFHVKFPDGQTIVPASKGIKFTRKEPGLVTWTAEAKAGNIVFHVDGRLEADGFLAYEVRVESPLDILVQDIAWVIPMNESNARYMLGLGRIGGMAPDEFKWKWDPYFNNDGPWIGEVNLGLQSSFRDENYERPLNTNFYHQKPLKMPDSWYNDGKGGILLERSENVYEVKAYSGERTLKKGETLHFYMQFLITPFHAMDTKSHWKNRYYHKYEPIDSILAYGGNTINVHHATEINPYINYPFMTPDIMKDYIDEAHDKNAKVKIYYTVRELTNICPEIWALKSLGDEVLSYGPGGGYSWLQEHLDGNYIGAWFVPDLKDAAIINSGVSRWHNYYLEGLNWLVNNVGIDGLYIDDVAFDRSIMKRVRKILLRGNPGALIDLHSANQFNQRDGFTNSSNLYLEHFAYIDRLWFGEYFDYDASPDYWLTEVSGIPFGLMGEMLEKGGNPWRGMLYGMTSRAPWSGDPSAIWKVWDEFGIENSEMIGYWVKDCPVKTGRPDVLATVYKKPDKILIAIASWAHGPARIELEIDWKSMGINPDEAELVMPYIKDFQEEGKINSGKSFTIPEGKGYLIECKTK
ncbi:MAG: DUF6067 family protein [Bacteroidota bacterium]|nr:DUF6067 family protein [Bacteroidota bacterium]